MKQRNNVAIKIEHVTKRFKLYYDKASTLKEKIGVLE